MDKFRTQGFESIFYSSYNGLLSPCLRHFHLKALTKAVKKRIEKFPKKQQQLCKPEGL